MSGTKRIYRLTLADAGLTKSRSANGGEEEDDGRRKDRSQVRDGLDRLRIEKAVEDHDDDLNKELDQLLEDGIEAQAKLTARASDEPHDDDDDWPSDDVLLEACRKQEALTARDMKKSSTHFQCHSQAHKTPVDTWWLMDSNGPQHDAARKYLERNYPMDVCEVIWARLVDATWNRDVVICKSCTPHVEDGVLQTPSEIRLCDYAVDPVLAMTNDDSQTLSAVRERWQDHELDEAPLVPSDHPGSYVLGRSVEEFASAIALLTDHEEMAIALVHPLVQVYTIPRTGQLAYVGHVCNFRQKVAKFLTSLPILKHEFPFVMVRPRSDRNRPSGKAPFKVNVQKLHHAFLWLKKHNPYYYNVEWVEARAAEWMDENVRS